MKDIPMFTGSHGMATLILREIPYRAEAYILLRAVFDSEEALIRECVSFCRMAGAERCFVSGKGEFLGLPVYATLLSRSILCKTLPNTAASAVPAENKERWLQLYREKFKTVPAANSCPGDTGLYFIMQDDICIGIGQLAQNTLLSVAALVKGNGADCVSAMAALCAGEEMTLLCAKENLPAMRLYDRLSFSIGEIKEIWYRA